MSKVWELTGLTATEKLILLAIADHANDDGFAYPSIVGLQAKTCLSERGVQTIIRRLQEVGLLSIQTGGGRGGKNLYQVILTAETPQQMPPQHMQGLAETPQLTTETPQLTTLNPAPAAPEPSITINKPSYYIARAEKEDFDWSDFDPNQKEHLDHLERELRAAGGEGLNSASAGLLVLAEPLAWVAAGADVALHILPVVRGLSKTKSGSIKSWKYFSSAVLDATKGQSKIADAQASDDALESFMRKYEGAA